MSIATTFAERIYNNIVSRCLLYTSDIAYQKLAIVTEALNGGQKLNVCDANVKRWYPWFKPNGSPSSFAFYGSDCVNAFAFAGCGSRLCLKSEKLSNYCGKQFIDLWKQFIL